MHLLLLSFKCLLLSNIYDQQDGLGYCSRCGPGTSIFDLDAIILTMILLLPQLALTEIVAGLYGAVVVRSFILPLLYSVVNGGPTGRTSEDVFESRE